MTILDFLKELPNFQQYSRKSKILLISYYLRQYKGIIEFSLNDIKQCCSGLIKPPSQLNKQLDLLSKGKHSSLLKANSKGFYALALSGLHEVESFLSPKGLDIGTDEELFREIIPYLRKNVISKLSENNQKKFLAEAISCLAVNAHRASIIMVWECVIDHLYDYILKYKISEFNDVLHQRTDRISRITITVKDDFSDLREFIFIEICRSAHIISGDVKKILNQKLDIRNTYAHPSDIEIGKSKVVDFIEDLIDNVIAKYPI